MAALPERQKDPREEKQQYAAKQTETQKFCRGAGWGQGGGVDVKAMSWK